MCVPAHCLPHQAGIEMRPTLWSQHRDFAVASLIRVRVQRMDDVLEVCPTILTEDSMQAQHLAATLALYNLVKGQVTRPED